MNTDKRVYTRREYFTAVIDFAAQAGPGDRLHVATMEFKPHFDEVSQVVDALAGAASRGAQVHVLIDAFAFMAPTGRSMGPLWYGRSVWSTAWGKHRHKQQQLKKLLATGATVTVTNLPHRRFSLYIAGRSHIKFAVLNDDVFVGGCNMSDPDQVDIMLLRPGDQQLADILTDLAVRAEKAPKHRLAAALEQHDMTRQLDDGATLLIDAGIAGSSVIATQAYGLLQTARQRALVTCQFPPYGWLVNAMRSLHRRGVVVQVYFNSPARFSILRRPLMYASYAGLRLSAPRALSTAVRSRLFIHAKLILVDDSMMIGSHNYVPAGVRLGTAELALICHDESLVEAAKELVIGQL